MSGGDTVDSIQAAIDVAYKLTAQRSGIGIELTTRAPKDPVKGGMVTHSGKHSYYKHIASAVAANSQVTRGGSSTVTYTVLDPEVDALLTMKQQRTPENYRIDTLDYSIAVNNLFLKKAAKKELWMCVSPYYAPKLWELFYSEDEGAFEKEYERVLASDVKKKVVDARGILKQLVEARRDTGRNYITFINNVNKHTPFKEEIRLSNLCVAPETKVLTDSGYVPIAEIEGETVNVWNGEEWSSVEIVKTGENQRLLNVKTENGYELDCTPYHKFYVFNGYGKPYKEVRACELKAGDKLAKFDLPVIEGCKSLQQAYINGFYSGDGCCVGSRQRIYLYGEKRKLEHLFEGGVTEWYHDLSVDRQHKMYRDLKDKFFVPTSEYTIESRLEWLAGYLDADGCIYRNGTNEAITAASVELEFLKEVQLMLQTLGVSAKITPVAVEGYRKMPANDGSGELKDFWCKDAYRLLITSCDSFKLLQLGLNLHRLEIAKRLPARDAKRYVKVQSVSDNGRVDDTYCLTEPKRHMVMFNGILTGQCQEVLLPTKPFSSPRELYKENADGTIALCFLGSIVVDDYTDEEYEDLAYTLCKIIDNTIDDTQYPFESMEATAKGYRSIGVGMTNVAHWMAKNGYRYDTEEGRNALHRLAERHSYFLHKASVRLAKEKGQCKYMDRTKYAEGWIPSDTYTKTVDMYHSQEDVYDWESLKEDILEHGVRFSVLESYMPVESSSLVTGSTNSLYPVRDLEIYKNSRKGSVYFRAPDMDTVKYQYAWDIASEDMVKVYAIVQKWCGQGISADFYHDYNKGPFSDAEMMKSIFLAAKLGMKTWYYHNFRMPSKDGSNTVREVEEAACESCTL
jgi:ribonucleoside-diphosphate reductase alpha chain